MAERSELIETLQRLARALDGVSPAETGEGEASRLAKMVRGHLLPRLSGPSRPALVVFAGPTGSGKSTLLNTLAGHDVSRTGSLRPTTTEPIVLSAPRHSADYETIGGVKTRVVMGNGSFLEEMTLVDTPDLDSTEVPHRQVAETMIDHADIVVFVTSALRYADEVPWQVLRRAVSRGAPVINVLNRLTSPSAGAVVDFRSRLSAAGLDDHLVTVPEHHLVPGAQRLPAPAVRSLWSRLHDLVATGDEEALRRQEGVIRSLIGAVDQLIATLTSEWAAQSELETELATGLGSVAGSLDLAAVGRGLHSPPPAGGRRAGWARRNRRSLTEIAELEEAVGERVVDLTAGAMTEWLGDRGLDPGDLGSLRGTVAEAVGPVVSAWLVFVRRIVEEQRVANLWLGEAVLVDSALTGEPSPGAVALYGEEAPTLVERAARELRGRLEDALAALAVGLATPTDGGVPPGTIEELSAAREELAAHLASVHA